MLRTATERFGIGCRYEIQGLYNVILIACNKGLQNWDSGPLVGVK